MTRNADIGLLKIRERLNERQKGLFHIVRYWHRDQKRKYTGEPYVNHLLSVAGTVMDLEDGVEGLVEIALCHDLFEDTDFPDWCLMPMLQGLGYASDVAVFISKGVSELTDEFTHAKYPGINRAERKELEALRLGSIKPEFQTVKYADLIDNTKSIVEHDENFAKIYMSEKRRILAVMREGDSDLRLHCNVLVKSFFAKLEAAADEKKLIDWSW